MNPTQLITYLLITVALATTTSCKRKHLFDISGVVTNKANGQPIEGAEIWLRDNLDRNDPSIVQVVGISDAKGNYRVKIETEKSSGLLIGGKLGYRWVNPNDGSEVVCGVSSGVKQLNLQLEGTALFNGYFQKNSSTPKSTDVVKINILSYENINEIHYSFLEKEYKGEGPFTFYKDGTPLLVLGDRYLRYKLEFSGDGGATFQTKIDSVFLPTSLTEYKETIYY
jgi:hypothetical protein